MSAPQRVTAVLGPTNTGKTHYAIERMLAHRTGIIGLPLRLLAREVYDRIVRLRGPSCVALVTGEERIVPDRAQYWVCTVEAMPEGMAADFLAVDEIQLCADPERGHVFTDRLLSARGLHETLFMGSETMRGAIAALVPGAMFLKRERFSTLTWTGSKKISRLPERSAIVGFSVENVYAIAEYIRRTRGGAAVVMGALSPRTRNAQVELYQNGEVDFLVATDAIGMGLNLDIAHVAFSGLLKFDGHRLRELQPDELAQIAGRAGRYQQPGTFGVTGEAPELDDEVIAQIENHSFRPVNRLMWRNTRLQFGSVGRLIQTLEEKTHNPWLGRVRESDDLAALKALADDAEVRARASDGTSVRLLWDVCRVPDFRGISKSEHAHMLGTIYNFLHQRGEIPREWFAEQVQRIDRPEGDIDTLSKRLAFIRTWTYVAQRKGWVADEYHWRAETRAVEDRLSDALHGALTQAFVDRRTSVLARRLRQKEALVAEVNDKGEVTVEGQFVGRLEGFRFRADKAESPEELKTLRQAAVQALAPQFNLRADRFYNAPDTEIDYTEQGGLMWGEHAVGRLEKGPEALKPQVIAFVDEEAGPDVAAKVQRRLQHFIDRKIVATMESLLAVQKDETLTGLAKGFAFRLVENLGIIPRGDVAEDVKALDQEARASLRKLGVRFGQFTVFLPPLLKPAPTRLRLVLWGLAKGLDEIPAGPPPGHVTVPAGRDAVPGYYAMSGYRAAGDRAIRIDMLERLADILRDKDSRAGFEAQPEMLSITGLSLDLFAGLMTGLGYRADKAERVKVRAPRGQAAVAATTAAEPAEEPVAAQEPVVPRGEEPEGISPVAEPGAEPAVVAEGEPGGAAPTAEPAMAGDGAPEGVPPSPEGTPAQTPEEVPGAPSEVPETPVETPAETPQEAPVEMPPEISAEVAAAAAGEMQTAVETAVEGSAATPAQAPAAAPAEMEVFYTFTWRGTRRGDGARGDRRQGNRGPRRDGAAPEARGDRPQRQDRRDGSRREDGPRDGQARDGQPRDGQSRDGQSRDGQSRDGQSRDGKPRDNRGGQSRDDQPRQGHHRGPKGKPQHGGKPQREDRNRPQTFEAHPPREDTDKRNDRRKIDPDSPFAALASLMNRK